MGYNSGMRALRVHQLGEPIEVLKLDEVPIPTPGSDEVVIRIEASALNFPDALMCRGGYQERPELPFVPGFEMAGVVHQVGDSVVNVAPGDRVIGSPKLGMGCLAEYSVAVGSQLALIGDMPFDAAAALRTTYYTSHVALHRRARLQPGETVLVHAGAGGVGSAAIQLAKAHGCRVIATAGGADKVAVCRSLGADLAIDYRSQDFVAIVKEFTDGEGADVIYDPVGGDTFDQSTKVIAWEGRILIVGFTSGRIAESKTNHVLVKNYSVVGVHWATYARRDPAEDIRVHADLMRLYANGLIDPLVSEIVPLVDAPQALTRLINRGTVGKIVVHPHE